MKKKINILFNKIKAPFQQGLGVKELFKAVVVGLLISVFPVFGTTTIIITCLALYLRLNLPVMITVSYLAAPLQVLFFMPFISIGEYFFNVEHSLLTFESIKTAFSQSFLKALKDLSLEVICGVTGWAITAVPIALLLITSFNLILKLKSPKLETN